MALTAKQQVDDNVSKSAKHLKKKDDFDATARKVASAGKEKDEDEEDAGTQVVQFSKPQYDKAEQDVRNALAKYADSKSQADRDKAAIKTAYANAAKIGIPKKALKIIVEKLYEIDDETKADVNNILSLKGEQPYFNFTASKQ